MEKIIPWTYIPYMGSMIGIGILGDMLKTPMLVHIAAAMGMFFMLTVGLAIVAAVAALFVYILICATRLLRCRPRRDKEHLRHAS
jgi:hypothetical protein